MKTYKLLLILFIPLMFGITSCSEDFLEVDPSHAISAESTFSDTAKIDAFITGIYDRYAYYYYTQWQLMASDVRGYDAFVKPSGNYNRFVNEYQFNLLPSYNNPRTTWWYSYRIIANANQAIYNVPQTSFSEAYKTNVVAEARAIRATAYICLIHFHAQPYSNNPAGPGAPITLEPLSPDPAEDWPGRSTVQEVYDVILADLLFAEANLNASKTDITRITPNVIKGLLARTYLEMGNWANASAYAIAARTGYPLAPAADLLTGFADATPEWMWSLDMRGDDNNGYLMLPSFWDNRTLGYSSLRVTTDFAGLFEAGDTRNSMMDAAADGGVTVTKYLHRSAWDMDQVLMRSAEMYLIEAEAEAQLGNTGPALTALNAVQTRVGATLTTTTVVADLLDEIAVERRKELFGEGFHGLDILRRGEPLLRTNAAHWAPADLAAYDPLMIFPIPQDEIDANPNISESDQNEGYR